MSVFSTSPPNISVEEAEAIVMEYYGIKVAARLLDSERDQNFLCSDPEGTRMVLKISNPDEDRVVVEMQNECMKHVRDHCSRWEVPFVIPSIEKKEITVFDRGVNTYFVRLLRHLPGPLLKDVVQDDHMLYELGLFLGDLCVAMSSFKHPYAHRDFPWDIAYIDFIRTHKHYVSEDVAILDYFVGHYEENVLPNISALREAVIHNDANDQNVLAYNDGSVRGIIDFGDVVYSFVACEPAVCMSYVALERDEPLGPITQVLRGFHDIFPLNKYELRAVIYMMCIRLCITVTMAAYRKNLFPENKYISVSEAPAWDFLKKMQNVELRAWSRGFSELC